MIDHIEKPCGIGVIESPTIIFEDNAACVVQIQTGYIKTNYTKYIFENYFTHMNYKKVRRLVSYKLNHTII
jgi:hypothetical protein